MASPSGGPTSERTGRVPSKPPGCGSRPHASASRDEQKQLRSALLSIQSAASWPPPARCGDDSVPGPIRFSLRRTDNRASAPAGLIAGTIAPRPSATSELLGQPGGFEGLAPLGEILHLGELPVAKRGDGEDAL